MRKKLAVREANKENEKSLEEKKKEAEQRMKEIQASASYTVPGDIESLSNENLTTLYSRLKTDKNFYKSISIEKHREKAPFGYRYLEADNYLSTINDCGKKVKAEMEKRRLNIPIQ
jgi:hypothetical protein